MTIATTRATGPSPTSGVTVPGTGETALDPNMFLKLLVAEIQNQDPSKPMDSAQIVQQLSAMSLVQQGAQANSRLATIMDMLSIGQSAALIGRSITSAEGVDLGVVEAVRYTEQGLIARLQDGREVLLRQGTTVRA